MVSLYRRESLDLTSFVINTKSRLVLATQEVSRPNPTQAPILLSGHWASEMCVYIYIYTKSQHIPPFSILGDPSFSSP